MLALRTTRAARATRARARTRAEPAPHPASRVFAALNAWRHASNPPPVARGAIAAARCSPPPPARRLCWLQHPPRWARRRSCGGHAA
eukprot:5354678-Prymnesium_polylepis.1